MFSLPLKVREGNLKESIIYCFFTQLICVCFTSVQTHGAASLQFGFRSQTSSLLLKLNKKKSVLIKLAVKARSGASEHSLNYTAICLGCRRTFHDAQSVSSPQSYFPSCWTDIQLFTVINFFPLTPTVCFVLGFLCSFFLFVFLLT